MDSKKLFVRLYMISFFMFLVSEVEPTGTIEY